MTITNAQRTEIATAVEIIVRDDAEAIATDPDVSLTDATAGDAVRGTVYLICLRSGIDFDALADDEIRTIGEQYIAALVSAIETA